MKTLARTVNIVSLIFGLLAIIGSLDPVQGADPYAMLGGLMFLAIGWINVANNQ